MIIHKWISSDGSELVPTTDVKINLTYWGQANVIARLFLILTLCCRNYSAKKINENMECEIMHVVVEEAHDSYKYAPIDITLLSEMQPNVFWKVLEWSEHSGKKRIRP
jgi:broad-specificity NMP kinase